MDINIDDFNSGKWVRINSWAFKDQKHNNTYCAAADYIKKCTITGDIYATFCNGPKFKISKSEFYSMFPKLKKYREVRRYYD